MGKRKFSFWLSMGALCLCLATLAFGVYSAKQARLTTNGTVSFKANDCKVKVVGTISNAMRSESLNYAQVSDKTYSNDGSGNTVSWADSFTTGDNYLTSSDAWTFGDIYFDDMNIGNDEEIKSIIITLQISNYSSFPVKASFTAPTELDSNLSIDGSVMEVVLDKMTTTTPTTDSLVLKLTVTDTAQDINLQDLNLDVNFEKTSIPNASVYGRIYQHYENSSSSYIPILQIYNKLTPNENGEIEIPSIVKKDDGSFVKVEQVQFSGISQPAGTPVYSGIEKIILPEGVKKVRRIASEYGGYVGCLVLPTTYESGNLSGVYEIYNKSSIELEASISNGGTICAVHTNMDEASVLKSTSDGLVYYVDTTNSKSYLLGIKNGTTSVTLPTDLDGFEYDVYDLLGNSKMTRWAAGYTGKILVNSNEKYISSGTVLIDKTDGSVIWFSKTSDTLTFPEGTLVWRTLVNSSYNNSSLCSCTIINIPSSLTSIGSIPNTVKTITVDSGNTTYKIDESGNLVKISDNTIVWTKPAN